MRHGTLITTGGTIEQTYDEQSGELVNRRSMVKSMLRSLRLEDTTLNTIELMEKDSSVLTDRDRTRISDLVGALIGDADAPEAGGIVILHGTDTLCDTGEHLHAHVSSPTVPIVLTGALRPFEMKRSDALQNLTEAIFAAGILEPGIYCVAHGRAMRFPGVIKDKDRGTFIRTPEADPSVESRIDIGVGPTTDRV